MTTDVSYYYPDAREALGLLLQHYKSNNDLNNQLKLLTKVIRLDSISNEKLSELNTNIIKNYDTQNLISEKQKLIDNVKNKNKKVKYYILLFIVLFLIVVIWLRHSSKNKIREQEKKHQEKLSTFKLNNSKSKKSSELELPFEIVDDLLKKLEHFEKNGGFLKADLTLAKTAKMFKTNSTYLSKVINTKKRKNFASFVNDLRIDYCIDLLKKDQKFRKYSIQAMANEVGFNSVKSFSSAFYKKTGDLPSFYIKSMKIK